MKYEMIFGNEKLFDGACLFSGVDIVTRNVDDGLYRTSRLSDCTPSTIRKNPIVAMRRIIKEPKRWTVADQEAGRLPEVGAEFQTSIGKRKCVITEGKFIFTVNDDAVEVFTIDSAMPLESPREKYERERDEFIDKVCIFVDVCTVSESIKQAHRHGAVKVYEQLKPFKEETK